MQIYTIGHSKHTREQFLKLLAGAEIEVLVDVRSNPHSKWNTFANRDNLKGVIESAGIQYLYMGDLLGGRPSDADVYNEETGKADYLMIQEKDYFKEGINRLLDGLKKYRVCIMCAEENPNSCHRNFLVAENLRKAGVKILHIRGDGRIQTDEELWKEKVGVADEQVRLM